MKYIEQLRAKGVQTLIAAAAFIVILLVVNFFVDIQQNKEMTHTLMDRELQIADLGIEWELNDVAVMIDQLGAKAGQQLDHPDKMFDITREVLSMSDIVQAVSIGFQPSYYPQEGYWFEPRCLRQDSHLVTQQGGDATHDYFHKKWYRSIIDDPHHLPKWTAPYADNSQTDSLVMTFCSPLYDSSKQVVGVMGVDLPMQSLQNLLKSVEPYPGSICQLLDGEGKMILSSGEEYFNTDDYFIGDKTISQRPTAIEDSLGLSRNFQVRLACPKSVVYGPALQKSIIAFILMIAGLILLAYLMQQSLRSITQKNAASQQQKTMENETLLAHDLQMNILRNDFPKEISATLIPMKEVGGDLYDVYKKDDTLFFIIGDVSGKGLSAATMMASTTELFRMAVRHVSTPAELMSEINHIISRHNPNLMFVTAFVGKIDLRHGLFTYCNAGHNPPVLNGHPLTTDPDIPMGYNADYSYRQTSTLFPKGSRLVLYTNGITEAQNAKGQFMGFDRLLTVIDGHSKDSANGLVTRIISAANQFAGLADKQRAGAAADVEGQSQRTQRDDMTVMCIDNNTDAPSPTLTINNDFEELSSVKHLLREYCICLGCDHQLTQRIVVAAEEAISNVINYAYPEGEQGRIDIDFKAVTGEEEEPNSLTIAIADSGAPFDPLSQPLIDVEEDVDDRQEGGLGIYLYQQLMDSVSYERTDDGRNVLTMKKVINNQ